jgi:thioredoxin 1
MRFDVTYDISIKSSDKTVNGFHSTFRAPNRLDGSMRGTVRNITCISHNVNLRITTLSMIALAFLATAFATYHRKTQSRTAPFSQNRVTAEVLDKARAKARTNQKFLMVEFGADWCSDCLELSKSLEEEAVRDYLKAHFVVLNVDVGQFNRNIDVAKSLGVDINQGIPTAVFFSPGSAVPAKKLGTSQILAYLHEVVDGPKATIQ